MCPPTTRRRSAINLTLSARIKNIKTVPEMQFVPACGLRANFIRLQNSFCIHHDVFLSLVGGRPLRPRLRRTPQARGGSEQVIGFCFARNARKGRGKLTWERARFKSPVKSEGAVGHQAGKREARRGAERAIAHLRKTCAKRSCNRVKCSLTWVYWRGHVSVRA